MGAISANRWFHALDGRLITFHGELQTILIHGIHADGDGVWIQISLGPDRSLLLHVDPHATIEEVLSSLEGAPDTENWLDVPHAA